MINENQIDDGKKEKRSYKKKQWLWMYNRWIVKIIPFYFIIAALAINYIANGHYADKTMKKINDTETQLKEKKYEFKTVKQEVIFRTKESELAKALAPLGLKPLTAPPLRIIDTLK